MHNAIPEHGSCEALSRPASITTTAAALRVYIEPLSLGHRGQYYSVSFEGRTLIAKTLRPSSDACRALVQLGFSGPLEIWGRERSYHAVRFPACLFNAFCLSVHIRPRGSRHFDLHQLSDRRPAFPEIDGCVGE